VACSKGACRWPTRPRAGGDQRFYQIELHYRAGEQDDQMVLKVPENQAPAELVRLWDLGELL
jgi:hypothetical protein